MLPSSESIRMNRWSTLIIGLAGLVLISSCVSSTLNTTISASVRASHAYNEIKTSIERLSEGGEPSDYEALIEKSRAFIKAHPKYRQVDEVYYSPSRHQFVNKPAPDFQVMDIRGEELSLAQYRGQVVLLDFWATWCGPCTAEMPNVKQTYAKHKNRKFQIIGISLDRSMAPLDAYIQGERIEWRQYLDSSGRISSLYNVRAIPSTFLIDGAGIVRRVNLRGYALENAVAELVQENLAN